jgi:hypothetical protein
MLCCFTLSRRDVSAMLARARWGIPQGFVRGKARSSGSLRNGVDNINCVLGFTCVVWPKVRQTTAVGRRFGRGKPLSEIWLKGFFCGCDDPLLQRRLDGRPAGIAAVFGSIELRRNELPVPSQNGVRF